MLECTRCRAPNKCMQLTAHALRVWSAADASRCAARATVRGCRAPVFQGCSPLRAQAAASLQGFASPKVAECWGRPASRGSAPESATLRQLSSKVHCHPEQRASLHAAGRVQRAGIVQLSSSQARRVHQHRRRASPRRVRGTNSPLALHRQCGTTVVMSRWSACSSAFATWLHIRRRSPHQAVATWPLASSCGGGLRRIHRAAPGERAQAELIRSTLPSARSTGGLSVAACGHRAAAGRARRRLQAVPSSLGASFHGRASPNASGPLHCHSVSGPRFRQCPVPRPSTPRCSPPWLRWLRSGGSGPRAPAAQQVHPAEAPVGAPLMLAFDGGADSTCRERLGFLRSDEH